MGGNISDSVVTSHATNQNKFESLESENNKNTIDRNAIGLKKSGQCSINNKSKE